MMAGVETAEGKIVRLPTVAGIADPVRRIERALDRVDYLLAVAAAIDELKAKGWRYDS
jgi:hypothetical protein